MTDDLDEIAAEIKKEFDLGGYFSDRSHTEKAEALLDDLIADYRKTLALLAAAESSR